MDMLPDADVLALADSQLGATDQERLDDLLGRNREGTLDDAGRRALDALMQVYEQGMLRKAQALRVAVQRGLRGPLSA